MRFEEDTQIYFCKVCDAETPHTYIPAEHGDRYTPGWDACYQCDICDDHVIEMWELDDVY